MPRALDDRHYKATVNDILAIPVGARYVGMEIYAYNEDEWYQFVGGTQDANLTLSRDYGLDEHDYKIWYVDGNNGKDTNTGTFSKPFETLQAAYDARVADTYAGVGQIKIMTSGSYGTLNIADDQTYKTEFIGEVDEVSITTLSYTDSRYASFKNLTISTLDYNQVAATTVFEGTDVLINDVTGAIVSHVQTVLVIQGPLSKINIDASTPDINITCNQGARFETFGTFALTDVFGDRGYFKIKHAGCTIGDFNINGGEVWMDGSGTLEVTTEFTHDGVAFINKDAITISGTDTLVTGEWAEGGGPELTAWYVNKSGSDDNNGSPQGPFLTVQKAVDSSTSGDVIFIYPGDYAETVTILDDHSLSFEGVGGSHDDSTKPEVEIDNVVFGVGADYSVDGISIKTATVTGSGAANDITIKHCEIEFENCSFSDVRAHGCQASSFTNVTISSIFDAYGCEFDGPIVADSVRFQFVKVVGDISAAGGDIQLHSSTVFGNVTCSQLYIYNSVITGSKTYTLLRYLNQDQTYGVETIRALSSGVLSTLVTSESNYGKNIIVAAETGTTDDLVEITGLLPGDKIMLRADTGDTITVKHNDVAATIKIITLDDNDLVLDEVKPVEFVLTTDDKLVQLGGGSGGGGGGGETIQDITIDEASKTTALVLDADANVIKITLAADLTSDAKPSDWTGWIEGRQYAIHFIKQGTYGFDGSDALAANSIGYDADIEPFEVLDDIDSTQKRAVIHADGLSSYGQFGRMIVTGSGYVEP